MAVAPRRGPDIITSQSIPLSATSDQPVDDVPRPPVSASAHPDDIAAGKAVEITPQELAVADAARRGVTEPTDEGEQDKEDVGEEGQKAAGDDPSSTEDARETRRKKLDEDIAAEKDIKDLPFYAKKEITVARKRAREATAKAEADAKAAADAVAAAKAETEATRKELEALKAKAPEPVVEEKPDQRPLREDFDDPDAYDEELTAWGKREGLREADATRQKELADAHAADDAAKKELADAEAEKERVSNEQAAAKLNDKWQSARTTAIEKYPDYVEVVEADPKDGGPTISPVMALALLHAENGTDVAYHLGNNPEESLLIAQMEHPAAQLIAMGRLVERIANPPQRARRARPVEHVDTVTNSADTTDAEPDMNAYAERRMAQLNKDRRPFFPNGGIH